VSTSPTRDKIIEAIAATKDDNLRAVLMIMLAVLEEIGAKVDSVLADEATLKAIVLNGTSGVHEDDHKWIEGLRKREPDVLHAMSYAEERHKHGGYCDFASRKLAEEKDDAQSRRKLRDGLTERIAWGILVIIAAGLGFGLR
jgi:hypothetical protein